MVVELDLIRNFVLGRSCCTLCLKGVDTEFGIHLKDQVFFDSDNSNTMAQVLNIVLGPHMPLNFLSSIICPGCSKLVLKSYSFIKMVKDNFNRISNVLTNILKCLENPMEGLALYKTMYILQESRNSFVTCLDTKDEILSSSAAAMRLSTLTLSNIEISIEVTACEEENESKVIKKENALKVKKEEMLHDESDTQNFKCKSCLKVYPRLINLKRHYIRVHCPKIFKCPTCLKSFSTQDILSHHEQTIHGDKFVCSECGKIYKDVYSLKRHEEVHKEKIKCNLCGRVYKTSMTFKSHIELNICGQTQRKSQSDAVFECDICHKKYCWKTTLRCHITFEHGNSKQFVCSWCDKKFSALSLLRAHEVTHTGAKNFPCTLCGKAYVTKKSLMYHTRLHTGEKPFKCDYCDMTFYTQSRRTEHINYHHKEPKFECHICKHKFKRKFYLKVHMIKQHNKNSLTT